MTSLAAQTFHAFNTATHTISINKAAKPLGGVRRMGTPHPTFDFPDGSSITTNGRGRNHKVMISTRGRYAPCP